MFRGHYINENVNSRTPPRRLSFIKARKYTNRYLIEATEYSVLLLTLVILGPWFWGFWGLRELDWKLVDYLYRTTSHWYTAYVHI